MAHNIETIQKNLDLYIEEYFPDDFEFRPNQKETIIHLIESYVNAKTRKHTNILSAPTGSGKSIVALLVSGVLSKFYNKSSYILVSDLGLLNQYEKDIKTLNLPVAVLRGQPSYVCNRNGMSVEYADCRVNKIPYSSLYTYVNAEDIDDGTPESSFEMTVGSDDYSCARACEYINARYKASAVYDVVVVTYQFYLLQRNVVAQTLHAIGKEPEFNKRDLIIADEAHKIESIVSDYFFPKVTSRFVESLEDLIEATEKLNLQSYTDYMIDSDRWLSVLDFKTGLLNMIQAPTTEILFGSIKRYKSDLGYLVQSIEEINNMVVQSNAKKNSETNIVKFSILKTPSRYKKLNVKKLRFKIDDTELRKVLSVGAQVSDLYQRFSDYGELMEEIGHHQIIRDFNSDYSMLGLASTRGDKMISRYFHNVSDHELLMSATIGEPEQFELNNGLRVDYTPKNKRSVSHIKMPGLFSYDKSPIFVFPQYKLTYREKKENIKHVVELINLIADKHINDRGMIQTNSYEFMHSVMELCKPSTRKRLIMYNNANEKQLQLNKFKKSKDGIIIGPTLMEGLDFKDDLCRFLIIMKVPYGNLGNKVVKAKADESYLWYSNDTAMKIEQTLGRGIRGPEDYCSSYIVDGSYYDFFNRNSFLLSDHIKDRTIIVNS